jgi:formate dehydrogenase assembly factor FdhD
VAVPLSKPNPYFLIKKNAMHIIAVIIARSTPELHAMQACQRNQVSRIARNKKKGRTKIKKERFMHQ